MMVVRGGMFQNPKNVKRSTDGVVFVFTQPGFLLTGPTLQIV